jgi:hypothetical protein
MMRCKKNKRIFSDVWTEYSARLEPAEYQSKKIIIDQEG